MQTAPNALRRDDGGVATVLVPAKPGGRAHRRAPFLGPSARHLHDGAVPGADLRRQDRAAAERGSFLRLRPHPARSGCGRARVRTGSGCRDAGRPALLSRPRGHRRAAGDDRARARMGGGGAGGAPAAAGDAVHDATRALHARLRRAGAARIGVGTGAAGAAILAIGFMVGVHWGVEGWRVGGGLGRCLPAVPSDRQRARCR